MNLKKSMLVLLPVLAHNAFAGTMGDLPGPKAMVRLPDVVTVSFDFDWARPSQFQSIELQPGIVNLYDAKSRNDALVGGELFFSWQKSLTERVQG
jgi:hypothetical protein